MISVWWEDGLQEIRELIAGGPVRAPAKTLWQRKNSLALWERAGQAIPDRMQRLLSTSDWDPDALRDDLCSYVVKHLGATDGVPIVDETGF